MSPVLKKRARVYGYHRRYLYQIDFNDVQNYSEICVRIIPVHIVPTANQVSLLFESGWISSYRVKMHATSLFSI